MQNQSHPSHTIRRDAPPCTRVTAASSTTHLLLDCVRPRGEGRDRGGAAKQRNDAPTLAGPLVLRVGAGHTGNERRGLVPTVHIVYNRIHS